MQTHELIAHPDHPPLAVESIIAKSWWDGPHWLRLRWRIEGAGSLVLPPFAGRRRMDGLWQTTCFELFLDRGKGYSEFNLSPSEAWAAYDLEDYRQAMSVRPLAWSPVVGWRGRRSATGIFDAAIPRSGIPSSTAIGISAVIEEEGGRKSYWALRHPPGKPDFHHPDCFAGQLPPRRGP